jgi:hypothetical protein
MFDRTRRRGSTGFVAVERDGHLFDAEAREALKRA